MTVATASGRRIAVTAALALAAAAAVTFTEPSLATTAREPGRKAVPVEQCGPEDRPETGLQGQVPQVDRYSGRAAQGYSCNLTVVGAFRSIGYANMDSYRDTRGRSCVYYTDNVADPVLVPGSDVPQSFGGDKGGGIVLDVTDPTQPKMTTYLTTEAMEQGGEAVLVHHKRGLLVTAKYNEPYLAVYDVSKDCRHPRLLADVDFSSDGEDAPTGHGGCFQPDGNVYWMAGINVGFLTPIDISNPRKPRKMRSPWQRAMHDCAFLDDGKIGYFAEPGTEGDFSTAGLTVVDTSEVQQGKAEPELKELSLTLTPDSRVQNTVQAVTYNGRPYVFNSSEAVGFPTTHCDNGLRNGINFGYGRFFDVSQPSRPVEVSKVMTEVMLPENCPFIAADRNPQVGAALFLYDLHQCRTDRIHNPTVLGCSAFASGMRIWDIRDPRNPKEIAYYNAGTISPTNPHLDSAAAAPVFRRDLGMVMWVTAAGGFKAAKFREGVWPFPGDDPCPSASDWRAEQYDSTWEDCRARRAPSGLAAAPAQPVARAVPASREALPATGAFLASPAAGLVVVAMATGTAIVRRRQPGVARDG